MSSISKSIYPGFGNFHGNRFLGLCLIACICASCQPFSPITAIQASPTAFVIPEATETAGPIYVQEWNDWKSGPHSAVYDLGKGPNTYCSRCHSPQNWDSNAKIDPAPNCVSCKFPFEDSPRLAVGNPLIGEVEWKGIGCAVCHRVENGVPDPAIAWFDQPTNYYMTVTSSTDLCGKCHMDTQTLRYMIDLGDGAHHDFTCTDCHQPHSTAASCSNEQCHVNVTFSEEPSPGHSGHGIDHQSINCSACHDASGLDVGPEEGSQTWTTFRTTEVLGRAQTAPYTSHNLTIDVVCERCHFPENPLGILDSVSK
jgi:hypothetical protein